jgi:Flp pilus assembly pilin Flp
MWNLIEKLVKDESGQDLAEYGIALGVITVAVGAAVVAFGAQLSDIWTTATTRVATAAGLGG